MQPPSRSLIHVPCNHCGRDLTRSVHGISRLVRCMECGLIYVNPRPDGAALAGQYDRTYFECESPTFGGYEDYEGDRADIVRTFERRLRRIRPHLPAATPRHLDIGCATGLFLEVARAAGWDSQGLDLSSHAAAVARAKGFEVHCGELEEASLPADRFDVLTAWDFIEHVPDPAACLRECHRLLAPGGILILSTPDAGCLLAKLLRSNWLGYRSLDEHVYFFTRATMGAMLARAGLQPLDTHAVGKYLSLPRIVARLRYYTRIGSYLLRHVDRLVPDVSLYLNPRDTMAVIARKEPTR